MLLTFPKRNVDTLNDVSHYVAIAIYCLLRRARRSLPLRTSGRACHLSAAPVASRLSTPAQLGRRLYRVRVKQIWEVFAHDRLITTVQLTQADKRPCCSSASRLPESERVKIRRS
jgi:hypothetical protein